jgi:hypothetical protein
MEIGKKIDGGYDLTDWFFDRLNSSGNKEIEIYTAEKIPLSEEDLLMKKMGYEVAELIETKKIKTTIANEKNICIARTTQPAFAINYLATWNEIKSLPLMVRTRRMQVNYLDEAVDPETTLFSHLLTDIISESKTALYTHVFVYKMEAFITYDPETIRPIKHFNGRWAGIIQLNPKCKLIQSPIIP